jgi:uncharacterized membrane protein
MKTLGWAASALVMAFFGPLMFAGLDQSLAAAGWFPRSTGAGGFEGVAFAALFSASLAHGTWRRVTGLILGGLLAFVGLWASRYLIGTALVHSTLDSNLPMLHVAHWVLMLAAAGLGATLARMDPRRGRDWAIQGVLALVAVCIADGMVSMLGIDTAAMDKVLYYQTVELEVHAPVDDAELIYGLKPNSRLGGEGPWGLRMVSVNSHGARSPEYPTLRDKGILRTLIFGGSTLYGAGVSNGDTTPGAMDRMLGPNHEVWNFGVCAHNTTQAAHLAMAKLDELAPDRIILMITNTGRRAFMGGPQHKDADKSHYFSKNPYLYLENFPPPRGRTERWHSLGLQFSALYRTFAAWDRATSDPDTTYSDRADKTAVAKLEEHAAKRGVEVLYVLSPSRGSEINADDLGVPTGRWLDLNNPGRSGDYQQAHPPPKILGEYATSIVRWLKQRKQSTEN